MFNSCTPTGPFIISEPQDLEIDEFYGGHLTLPTWRVGMLPKLRVGNWTTLFFRGLESGRHYFSEGWKVADTLFLSTKPIDTKLVRDSSYYMPEL